MTDIERVQQMVDEGRITAAEGDRLIRILAEVEAEDAALQEAVQAATPEVPEPASTPTTPPQVATPPEAPIPAVPTTPTEPQTTPPPPSPQPEPFTTAPESLRWVRIEMLAGDLGVSVDDTISEPVASSDQDYEPEVETTPDGFRVSLQPKEGGFIDRMLSGFRSGRVELRIPVGYGAEIAATAGDIDLDGVPYLRGKMTAGDLTAVGLRGIDFTTMAGDVELGLTLTSGEHRIAATAGEVSLKFGADSHVQVNGSVSIGQIESRLPGFEATRQGLGQRFSANLGGSADDDSGTEAAADASQGAESGAKLDVRVATGELTLEFDRG